MKKIPVLITFFNRPDNLEILLASLTAQRDLDIYLACDGPRNQMDKKEIEKCWRLIDKFFPEVEPSKRLIRDVNLGCKSAMKGNIDWFFSQVDRGIILEDDCIPSSDFFEITVAALEKYESSDEIFGISGSDFIKLNPKKHSNTFRLSNFPMVWGWATWANRWEQYLVEIPDIDAVTRAAADNLFLRKLHFRKMYFKNVFGRRFYEVEQNIIDTWDYSLVATLWRTKKRFLQINGNTIINVGFSQNATHTKGKTPTWVPKEYSEFISRDLAIDKYEVIQDLWLIKNVYNCNFKEVMKNTVKGFIK